MNQTDAMTLSTKRWDAMAFSWGLLEAVTIFIVPDTWISRQALISWRAGLFSVLWSLAGAMLGGVILYLVASHYQSEILSFYDWLPGIGPLLITKAAQQLQESGVLALFLGGYTGTPFKLFAAQASASGIGFAPFVAVSLVSRGSRFLFTAAISRIIGMAAERADIRLTTVLWLHAAFWVVFYAMYWTVMAEWPANPT